MPEYIKLQQVSVNRMIIKMCCDNITVHIIGRMLNRSKFLNLFSHRKYDNSSRMLSGSPSHTGAALDNTVNLTVTLMYSTFFIIIFHITKGCFLGKCTNGTCLEGLALSENNLCISVSIRLIFSGKVKVNIRFLISLESQECFERNIKSLFLHFGSTFRAYLIRHITTCHSGILSDLRRIKITVFTVRIRAQIVGRQRINLCNS